MEELDGRVVRLRLGMIIPLEANLTLSLTLSLKERDDAGASREGGNKQAG
jgi:hypothetical protein